MSGEVASVVRATRKLWDALDLDTLVATAVALIQELAPGTIVDRCDVGLVAQAAARYLRRPFVITLSQLEVLVVVPCSDGDHAMLQAAAESIEARAHDLAERTTPRDSVERLGRSERLQRALYAIADQASAAGASLATMFEAL